MRRGEGESFGEFWEFLGEMREMRERGKQRIQERETEREKQRKERPKMATVERWRDRSILVGAPDANRAGTGPRTLNASYPPWT